MRHVRRTEQLTPWKEVPTVEIYTNDFAAARTGAAFLGACSPWRSLSVESVAGVNHVRTQNPALAAGTPGARLAAFWPVPAMTRTAALSNVEQPAVNGTRKQNVHKTRINAGGYGAMGPHPEREPA
jgi:hypothetical protein